MSKTAIVDGPWEHAGIVGLHTTALNTSNNLNVKDNHIANLSQELTVMWH